MGTGTMDMFAGKSCVNFIIVLLFVIFNLIYCRVFQDDLFLYEEHIPYFLSSHPVFAEQCISDDKCLHQPSTRAVCWGYEQHCSIHQSYSVPVCESRSQVAEYYGQADFGYIRQKLQTMFTLCSPRSGQSSSMNCTRNLEFCRARNVQLDFRDIIHRSDVLRYNMDVLKRGQMVADCSVDVDRLGAELEYMSPLQSWSPEVQHLVSGRLHCDVTIDTPTYIMKIDAAVSMYHHFCDFFNLYASQHLNESGHPTHPGSFHTDKQILIWENVPYHSSFSKMFQVFSSRPVYNLRHVAGQRVCFTDLVLPLPPRMIFGLFYNTPVVPGCNSSGLFRAFSQHVLHRLHVAPRVEQRHDRVHVAWISRLTSHRRVLNEQSILDALRQIPSITVVLAEFTHSTLFEDQVRLIAGCDVLVGMHGSGLTHLFFLPDWGVVYELYHCEDPDCYRNLAAMRGLAYITWQKPHLITPQNQGDHPQLGAHEKFTNYTLDVSEVVRQVGQAVRLVRQHPAFLQARRYHTHGTRDEL